ncbi:MerR family transcriptional regulator [Levilactobacillus lindianensis]|uniref:MerR family transcriptional regulator n=1 Tax=Levilactobacillus lindianensis TaxID=2486018 RepID=UPI000F749416|nr:MerR family transcriptional regulator [Levilactobacillus lindianensis]
MKSSDVAKKFDVSIDSLRYWEKAGMIPKVPRNSRGYRNYTQNEIEWIDFVTCMRSSGIGISTLVTYYQLFEDGAATKRERQKLLEGQLVDMAQRIKDMQKAYARLEEKLTHYDDHVEGVFTKQEDKK